jgi:protocatechuate 4,5-dioxygenase beta chain
VATIIAGVGSSHVPAIGAALDNGKTEEPYWKRVFSGFEKSKDWMAQTKPDVAIVVYNDHASAFSVDMIPTFALGCAAEFPPADEGWGPRPVPVLKGHPELAAHNAQSVILDEFDLSVVRHAEGVAVSGHPARGQRRHVSAADRPSLLHAGQGDP